MMLILGRRSGEKVMIGDNLMLSVLDSRPHKARFRIEDSNGGDFLVTLGIGESSELQDGIRFTMLSVHGKSVRIGFNAPPELPIHRLEVWQRVRKENDSQTTCSGYPK